jgi:hypothetical protein
MQSGGVHPITKRSCSAYRDLTDADLFAKAAIVAARRKTAAPMMVVFNQLGSRNLISPSPNASA